MILAGNFAMGHFPFFATLHLSARIYLQGLPRWLRGKESACQCKRYGFNSWIGKIPWRRKWQPTPVFLPRKSHGQRSLAGYSPWGCKRVGHNLATRQQHTRIKIRAKYLSLQITICWIKKKQPTFCRSRYHIP